MDAFKFMEILSFAIGIIGTVLAIIFQVKSKRTKEPCYAMKTETLIAGYSAKFDDLIIHYKDKEIENLSVSKIAFWNKGGETIDRSDIAPKSPLLIVANDEVEILDTKVLQQNNRSCNFSIQLVEELNMAPILFDYIDKGQGAVFQVIHTGTSPVSDLYVVGDIKGAKNVSFKSTHTTPFIGWLMIVFSVISVWFTVILLLIAGFTKGFETILSSWVFYFMFLFAIISTVVMLYTAIREVKFRAKIPKGLEAFK